MFFEVNLKKKKSIQKKVVQSRKGWMTLSHCLILVMILFSILFGIYGFGMKGTFLVETINSPDYGTKNSLLIWTILITVDVILIFLWVIQIVLAINSAGKYINQRIHEGLIITDSVIDYSYQNVFIDTSSDRVVITLLADSIRKVKIDKDYLKIEIEAMMCSVYYSDYLRRETEADTSDFEEDTFVIYDYFEPELIPYIEKKFAQKLEVE